LTLAARYAEVEPVEAPRDLAMFVDFSHSC